MVSRGIHIALYVDSEGIKFVFLLRLSKLNINKVKVLRKREVKLVKAPELEDPTMLTEVPTGKVIEPEDMDRELELEKPLEPEDM